MALRENELSIALPCPEATRELNIPDLSERILCFPGVCAVAMDPPREKLGVLYVPESGATRGNLDELERFLDVECEKFSRDIGGQLDPTEKKAMVQRFREHLEASESGKFTSDQDLSNPQTRLRPDSGTVVSSHENCPVRPGDRVLFRAYHGLETELFGVKDLKFFGVTHRLEKSLLCIWKDNEWTPLFDWVQIVRDIQPASIFQVRETLPYAGTIAKAGPRSEFKEGQRVALTNDPNVCLSFQFGDVDGHLVKESEFAADGSRFKQIWAVVE